LLRRSPLRGSKRGKSTGSVYLSAGSTSANPHNLEAFRQGLHELGWNEGRNIIIEYRSADGRFERLPELVAELVRLKVDVIAASPTPAALAARNATRTIPIVGMSLADPVGLGIITSLARPGGNLTGVSYSVGADIFGKDLDLLRQTVPKVRRVAVLSNPAGPSQALIIKNIEAAAQSLGLQLVLVEARGPEEFEGAFARMARERVGALFVVTDPAYCRRCLHRGRMRRRAASCPTGLTFLICIGAPPPTWTRSSRARSPPTSLSSSPPSSSS
jgi:putative ABC transport system substrate-binding protein